MPCSDPRPCRVPEAGSRAQALPALCPAGIQDLAAGLGGHACAETVAPLADQVAGLIGAFHRANSITVGRVAGRHGTGSIRSPAFRPLLRAGQSCSAGFSPEVRCHRGSLRREGGVAPVAKGPMSAIRRRKSGKERDAHGDNATGTAAAVAADSSGGRGVGGGGWCCVGIWISPRWPRITGR